MTTGEGGGVNAKKHVFDQMVKYAKMNLMPHSVQADTYDPLNFDDKGNVHSDNLNNEIS